MPPSLQVVEKLAVFGTTLENVVDTLKKVSEAVFGNTKTGLVEQTAQNQRDIIALQKSLNEHLALEKERSEALIKSKKEIQADARRMWISIILVIITSIMAIFETIITSRLILQLPK